MRSEHRLVIVRRDAGHRFVRLEIDGALPRLDSEEHRSADVAELNRAVRESLGLEVSVLRCLADEAGDERRPRRHLYVMEAHGAHDVVPAGARWISGDAAPFDRPDGADWTRAGWRDDVITWVNGELVRLGASPVTEIEQVRVWEFSQVLRLGTAHGTFYLKARPRAGAAEASLTRALSLRHPRSLPQIVAVDIERGWLLMREAIGHELMRVKDPERWEEVAAITARIQIDWLDGMEELMALGCPRRPLATLAAEVTPLLDDTDALQPPLPEGLSDAELATLRRRRGELVELCRELDASGVPDSLEHGDLWAANVIVADGGPVVLDWEDACITHPFITPSLLILSLDDAPPSIDRADLRHRIREAYLREWTERGPLPGWSRRRVDAAFDLAQQIAMVHYAALFRRGLPTIETSREVRGFVPFFLRRLLGVPGCHPTAAN